MITRRFVLLSSFVVALSACGTEVGRVPLTGEGTATSDATLKAGEVSFWTDLDIEYVGNGALVYDITLEQGVLTISGQPEQEERFRRAEPAGAFLAKPFSSEALLRALHALVAGRATEAAPG